MKNTIIITGTSNGFGNDAAKTLAAAGHRVFATMRDLHGSHKEIARDLESNGIETIELDVTSNKSVDAAFKTLSGKTGGKLDVLINNAGVFSAGLSETFTPEQVRDLFEVNVFGIQRVTRAALPEMRKNKTGLIINIGSTLGRVTVPFLGLYGASKFATEAMTETYRYELSQLGVDFVLVQPSGYPTNLYSAAQQPSDKKRGEEYGETAALPGKLFEFMQGMFSGANPPNPHDVAVALLKLVETPAGQRPARVLVGAPFGADAVNAATQPIQGQLIASLGMEQLSKLKVNEFSK